MRLSHHIGGHGRIRTPDKAFTGGAAPSAGYSAAVLADAPIGYWRLGESSGTNAADSSGNARNGTYVNTPTLGSASLLTSDAANTAVTFNGTNQSVSLGAGLPTIAPFTVEALVKPSSLPAFAQVLARTGAWKVGTESGKLNFTKTGVLDVPTVGTYLTTGGTNHVVWVFRADFNVEFWVDGVLKETISAASNPVVGSDLGSIASNAAGSEFFPGVLDEVAVYGFQLSSTRISAHFNAR